MNARADTPPTLSLLESATADARAATDAAERELAERQSELATATTEHTTLDATVTAAERAFDASGSEARARDLLAAQAARAEKVVFLQRAQRLASAAEAQRDSLRATLVSARRRLVEHQCSREHVAQLLASTSEKLFDAWSRLLEVQRLEADAMAELHARVGELHALEAEAGRDLDERSDVPVGELIRAASHTIRLAAAQELARRFGISGSSVELRSWCELTGFGAQHLRRAETSDDAPTPESEA